MSSPKPQEGYLVVSAFKFEFIGESCAAAELGGAWDKKRIKSMTCLTKRLKFVEAI